MKRGLFAVGSQTFYMLVDFAVISVCIMGSYKVYRLLEIGKELYYPKYGIVPVSLVVAAGSVGILYLMQAYRRQSSLLNMEEIKAVFKGVSLSFLLLALILMLGRIQLSRYVLSFSYIFCLLAVVVERSILYHVMPTLRHIRGFRKKVLIYGAGELGSALFREICNSPRLGKVVVGFVDDDREKTGTVRCSSSFEKRACTAPILGTRKDVERLIREHQIDEIYLAISNIRNATCIDLLGFLRQFPVKVRFVPNLYRVFVHRIQIGHIGRIPVIEELLSTPPVIYFRVKRVFDAVVSAGALMLLAPLFAVIGAAIRLDTRGPVFFRQKRVGMNGSVFEIYKFRSMRTDADPYAVNPLDPNDSRVTRVGRFLRKTSLDELPQLINVLKGDMSLVGPRPEMPFIVETYNEIHRERLKVLPGITGLWQLSGDRKLAIHENMDYDLYYIRNMSFSLDVAILLETLLFAFRGM